MNGLLLNFGDYGLIGVSKSKKYSLLPLVVDCVDKRAKCARFTNTKYCGTNKQVQNNCKATCNLCGKLRLMSNALKGQFLFHASGYTLIFYIDSTRVPKNSRIRFCHNKNLCFFFLS